MTPIRLTALAAAGLSAASCSYTGTTTQAVAPAYRSGSEQVCLDYGFRPGTDAYNSCVIREAEWRARGRVPRDYTMAHLSSDAQSACASYGLTPGTMTYDRCVGREIDVRRYREEAYVSPPAVTTYSPAPVTYAPAPAYAPAPVYAPAATAPVYAPPATTPPTGVQAFRDEYGFRYDGQGNRIDRNGNIISPQSTIP